MGFFKKRGLSIIRILLFIIVLGVGMFLLLRGLINYNIVN